MKPLLLILTILTAYSTDNERWFIWTPENREKTEMVVRENLHLIDFLPLQDLDTYLDNFYLIDLDNDNDLDLVYHGWSGAESNCIRFFINKNGEYVNSAFVWGDLIAVTEKESKNFVMHVNLPSCCGNFETRNYKIKTIVRKDSLQLKLLEVKIHHDFTKAPEKLFDSPIEFKVTNDPYHLRVTPEIDSINQFFPGERPFGNFYLTYRTGDIGKALGKHTDNTGRVWWYVEMEANKRYSRIEDNDMIVYPKFIGWMSSRYLEKIE